MNGNEAPLILASWYGNLQTVCELMENECLDVNVSDISGRTPLYCACFNNHFHVVEKLVNHPNIDVNTKPGGWMLPPLLYSAHHKVAGFTPTFFLYAKCIDL